MGRRRCRAGRDVLSEQGRYQHGPGADGGRPGRNRRGREREKNFLESIRVSESAKAQSEAALRTCARKFPADRNRPRSL